MADRSIPSARTQTLNLLTCIKRRLDEMRHPLPRDATDAHSKTFDRSDGAATDTIFPSERRVVCDSYFRMQPAIVALESKPDRHSRAALMFARNCEVMDNCAFGNRRHGILLKQVEHSRFARNSLSVERGQILALPMTRRGRLARARQYKSGRSHRNLDWFTCRRVARSRMICERR